MMLKIQTVPNPTFYPLTHYSSYTLQHTHTTCIHICIHLYSTMCPVESQKSLILAFIFIRCSSTCNSTWLFLATDEICC